MRDYLIRFDTQAARDTAFPCDLGLPGAAWTPVSVWLRAPQLDDIDDEGRAVPGRVAAPGFWIGLASTDPLPERHPATVVEMRRPDEPRGWRDCIVWSALPDIAPVLAVDPVFAGSGYIFD